MKYDSFSGTDVGKKRGANEDTYGDQKTINGHVFVVCDGMGGHVGGARASGMAVSSILEFFAKEPIENIIIGIDKAISFANEQIYATALNEPEYKGMGTTVTVSVIKDAEVFIGHVGDSRIYLKSNGKLNRITKDHSKVQELLDRNLITNAQAENHKEKNIILKALGIKPEVEATVCPVSLKLAKGDVLLMCSDGLSDLVNDKQMEAMINFDDLKGSVSSLIDQANNNGGPDNITATLIAIAESVHPVSVFQEFNPVITQEVGEESAEPTVDFTSSEQGGDRNWKMIILSGIGGIITLVFLVYLFFPSEEVSDNKSGQGVPIDETVKDTIPEREPEPEPEREAEPAPESGASAAASVSSWMASTFKSLFLSSSIPIFIASISSSLSLNTFFCTHNRSTIPPTPITVPAVSNLDLISSSFCNCAIVEGVDNCKLKSSKSSPV